MRSRILKRGTYEALRQSSLFVKTFVNWGGGGGGGGGVKISSSVQPVDLCYFSFSFNRVFFLILLTNKQNLTSRC